MVWKKLIAIAGLLVVVTLAGAYGTPALLKPKCDALTAAYIEKHPVAGHSFEGTKVAADPSKIDSYVDGPFTVVTRYSTPWGMHADIHSHKCSTVPWRVALGPRQTIGLL